MMTVREVSRETGVSVRTLHHYHALGLLTPTEVTEAGYRLYDASAVERLRMIILYRELGFPLGEIAGLLDAPDGVRNAAITAQIRQMEKRKRQLQTRIDLAGGLLLRGVNNLDMKGFEAGKIDEYAGQAETLYGQTEAWQEYQRKAKGRTAEEHRALGEGMMALFAKVGEYRRGAPDAPQAQAWAAELQAYISAHYYACTPEILRALGNMYAGGGSMTENIDRVGGEGTGAFAQEVIRIYCDGLK